MINFPCPKSLLSMKSIDGGYYCDYCGSEVLDLSSLNDSQLSRWREENGSACIVINEVKEKASRMPLSHFALALMIIGGGSFFNFVDAQLEQEITTVGKESSLAQDSSLGMLRVNVLNQDGFSTWGNAWVELPNGKELEMYEDEQGKLYVKIPEYCKDKTIHVYVEHSGKKKHDTVVFKEKGQEVTLDFKFRSKKMNDRIVRGYF